MALDFAYAPKFAPMPLAGGGGSDWKPPAETPVRTSGHGQPEAKPVPGVPSHVDVARIQAVLKRAPARKLKLTLRRHAAKRIAEERALFSATLAAHNAAIAAQAELEPAPIAAPRDYDRMRYCDNSCSEVAS